MTGRSMRELLAAEQQTRWEVMYRELKRRQKALQRAWERGSRDFEAAYMRHAKACDRLFCVPTLPASTKKYLDDEAVRIEAFAAVVREVGEAFKRNAEQLARHERALPGLRDTDPRAILAPDPYVQHRIAANARQRRYVQRRSVGRRTAQQSVQLPNSPAALV